MMLAASPVAPAQTAGKPVLVCPLMPKEEVKEYFPWAAALDSTPIEEEAVGTTGSSCNYPTLHAQVIAYSSHAIETMKKSGGAESIAGIGEAAYLRNDRGEHAEILVRVGDRMLTLQATIDGGYEAAKPKLIELAKAYVGKLR